MRLCLAKWGRRLTRNATLTQTEKGSDLAEDARSPQIRIDGVDRKREPRICGVDVVRPKGNLPKARKKAWTRSENDLERRLVGEAAWFLAGVALICPVKVPAKSSEGSNRSSEVVASALKGPSTSLIDDPPTDDPPTRLLDLGSLAANHGRRSGGWHLTHKKRNERIERGVHNLSCSVILEKRRNPFWGRQFLAGQRPKKRRMVPLNN